MADGEDAFARMLVQKACAQIIYAQAQRLASRPVASRQGVKGGAAQRPVSASNIFATERVADALADIAQAFIMQIGRSANARTELAGRTRSNLLDVLATLQSLAPITHVNTKDLAKYALFQEIPFPHPVPAFPVLPDGKKRSREVFINHIDTPPEGAESKPQDYPHIEAWMPPLPSSHTYVATPVFMTTNGKNRDRNAIAEQRRRVEMSLAQLKESQRNVNGIGGALSAVASAAPANPFLVPPKVGSGHAPEERSAGDSRELVETANEAEMDARDTNTVMNEVPKSAANDQKRARVERILAEGSGVGTTMESRDAS